MALALRGLDKMTGRATDIVAPINKPVKFATLTITVRTCYSTPPTEPPETTAFLEITDKRPDREAEESFLRLDVRIHPIDQRHGASAL